MSPKRQGFPRLHYHALRTELENQMPITLRDSLAGLMFPWSGSLAGVRRTRKLKRLSIIRMNLRPKSWKPICGPTGTLAPKPPRLSRNYFALLTHSLVGPDKTDPLAKSADNRQ